MDPFATSGGGVQPPGQQEMNAAKYHFTADEMRALRECNVESFYQRSLPIGTGLGLAAWAAVKQGVLKGSPKYGPIPKVCLGVVIGYFVGKFSYQTKCAEKIMRLPNSPLGEMLRKRRSGGGADGFPITGSFGMAPSVIAPETVPDNTHRQQNSLDMDLSRPSMSGLDDAFRPNLDSPITTNFDDNLPSEPPKNGTSYDELRKAHREEYYRRMQAGQAQAQAPQGAYQRPPVAPPQQQPQQPQESYQYNDPEPQRSQQKNKYGDVWT